MNYLNKVFILNYITMIFTAINTIILISVILVGSLTHWETHYPYSFFSLSNFIYFFYFHPLEYFAFLVSPILITIFLKIIKIKIKIKIKFITAIIILNIFNIILFFMFEHHFRPY